MTKLWTWGGTFFGHRKGDDLWTHDGRHVGRFVGDDVFGPNGRYLGEIRSANRLITKQSKLNKIGPSFSPKMSHVGYVPNVGFVGYVMIVGYQDFPGPDGV